MDCKEYIINEFLDYLRNALLVLGEDYNYEDDLRDIFNIYFKDLSEDKRKQMIKNIQNVNIGKESDEIFNFLKERLEKGKNTLDQYIDMAEYLISGTNYGEGTDPNSEYTIGALFATKQILKRCKEQL